MFCRTLVRHWLLGTVVASALWSHVQRADAVTRTWTGGVGGTGTSWSLASNWSPSGTPANGDVLTIPRVSATDTFVGYDYIGPAITLSSLTLSCTPFGGNPGTSYLNIGG